MCLFADVFATFPNVIDVMTETKYNQDTFYIAKKTASKLTLHHMGKICIS